MLQFTPVYEIKVEPDEDGFFHLIVVCEHEDDLDLPLGHQVAEQLYDRVKAAIGPWLAERDMARLAHPVFACNPDESGGYALDDPKHPNYHDAMADMWDNRDKTERRGYQDMRRDLGRAPTAQEWQDERR